MSRLRTYVDTSVIGGCFDEEFDGYSVQLFDEFISGKKTPIISDVVLFELGGGRLFIAGWRGWGFTMPPTTPHTGVLPA